MDGEVCGGLRGVFKVFSPCLPSGFKTFSVPWWYQLSCPWIHWMNGISRDIIHNAVFDDVWFLA